MTALESKREEIQQTLRKCRGNIPWAAKELGMGIDALTRLISTDPAFSKFRTERSFKPIEQEKAEMSKEVQIVSDRRIQETFNTRNVVGKLESLMDKVTAKECTTETVNAACNCAARITDILRVHLEVERLAARNRNL
ncbi:MAG: hypothetical protein A2428_03020 [Bdellovibrionales bacterium RIFOXYC1_FULL_54_43]|nr:MAG: hypothetical protein A2428_03020 [Bdellovibrionales bacterium RIFOXYC1_FULL_54_43]OFZ82653.1 MAG: hypothetical protein A2603_02455 [Bdellovibrionales bacterium RIFOXYD1_FULL_55_31]